MPSVPILGDGPPGRDGIVALSHGDHHGIEDASGDGARVSLEPGNVEDRVLIPVAGLPPGIVLSAPGFATL